MLVLGIFEVAAIFLLAFILITQVLFPAFRGGKLFPAFRKNPIRDEVEETRETVDALRDQTASLTELEALLKEKAELEEKIRSARSARSAAQSPTADEAQQK